MARTTGLVLTIGGITIVNQNILNDKPFTFKVPVATALACGIFALAERVWPDFAMMLATASLVTVLFVRLDGVPTPIETLLEWTQGKK